MTRSARMSRKARRVIAYRRNCVRNTHRGVSRVNGLTHESNHNAVHLYDRIADRSCFIQYRKLFA